MPLFSFRLCGIFPRYWTGDACLVKLRSGQLIRHLGSGLGFSLFRHPGESRDPSLHAKNDRGNLHKEKWVPAFAGMTDEGRYRSDHPDVTSMCEAAMTGSPARFTV